MGMYGKLRHIPADKMEAVRKSPTAFYKKYFGGASAPDAGFAAAKDFLLQGDRAQKMRDAMAAMPELQKGEAMSPEDMLAANRRLMDAVPELKELQQVMQSARSAAPAASAAAPPAQRLVAVNLDKSWHCLHFLLAGHPTETGDSPLGAAILGGTPLPDKNKVMGYGPVRSLAPDEVKQIAVALESFPMAARVRTFDAIQAAAAGVYSADLEAAELQRFFAVLISYYREAATKGHGMLLWIE